MLSLFCFFRFKRGFRIVNRVDRRLVGMKHDVGVDGVKNSKLSDPGRHGENGMSGLLGFGEKTDIGIFNKRRVIVIGYANGSGIPDFAQLHSVYNIGGCA